MTDFYLFYYITLFVSLLFYAVAYRSFIKNGIFLSASNLTVILYVFFIGLAGPYIASGVLFNAGFSQTLYNLYYAGIIIIPLFLICGNLFGEQVVISFLRAKRFFYRFNKIPYQRQKLTIITAFILIAGCIYFLNIDRIPLIELLKDPSISKDLLAAYRNYLTHDFEIGNVNFIINLVLRFSTIFLRYFSVILLGIFFYWALTKKRIRDWILFSMWFVWVAFICVYNFEKAPFLWICLGLMVIYNVVKKNFPITKLLFLAAVLFLIMLLMYVYFMGASDYKIAFSEMMSRLFIVQSKFSYLHLNQYWSGEPLMGATYPLTFLDSLYGRDTIDISKITYQDIYSSYYDAYGITGTTGGLNLANLYMNFGYALAFVIFSFLVFFVGLFDAVFCYLIKTDFYTPATVSVYSFLSVHFSLAIVMSLDHTFQLPLFFNGIVIFVLLLYLFLIMPVKINRRFFPPAAIRINEKIS